MIRLSAVPLWSRRMDGAIRGGPLVAKEGTVLVAIAPTTNTANGGAVLAFDASGAIESRWPLAALPVAGMNLDRGQLWVGLTGWLLERLEVPQSAIADSSWPTQRGGITNSGAASGG